MSKSKIVTSPRTPPSTRPDTPLRIYYRGQDGKYRCADCGRPHGQAHKVSWESTTKGESTKPVWNG